MKKFLSIALALTMCLSLSIPAFAAGTKKVVVDETHGVKITMDEFLRVETNRYVFWDGWSGAIGSDEYEIYVVADNSTVTVEALEGRKYIDTSLSEAAWPLRHQMYFGVGEGTPGYEEARTIQRIMDEDKDSYAQKTITDLAWNFEDNHVDDNKRGVEPMLWPLDKVETYTVSPADSDETYIVFNVGYEISWMCESDYAKLKPATLQTSDWAQAEMEKAYDAEIMPVDPYAVNCTEGMTRARFAATAVRLYAAMIGKDYDELNENSDHPFTDIDWQYSYEVGVAYNLGFVNGKGGTTFDPEGTLTRQEAAVMLSRVYAKVHGDIPKVDNTAFADDKDIADWAKSEVAFMSGREIVNGVGENRFAPTKTLSIQEAVIMAYRMLEKLK